MLPKTFQLNAFSEITVQQHHFSSFPFYHLPECKNNLGEKHQKKEKNPEELCEKERKSPAELWTGDSTRHKGK